jgi:eukaryotic-like serine/threonine-protein kinase
MRVNFVYRCKFAQVIRPINKPMPGTVQPDQQSMKMFEEGQMIGRRYQMERFLGEGAFGEVYRVRNIHLGRLEALKVFKLRGMTKEEVDECLEEPRLLADERMQHPNIVRIWDADYVEVSDGLLCYFTMEYVGGGSLHNYWSSFGNRLVPLNDVVRIMRQIASGLALAHRQRPPIVHRDIKPQNILIGYEEDGPRPRISDFGLAKRVNPLTLLASARGTRDFKAPEVFASGDSCASDVWALGTTMYLLLTDRFPYSNIEDLQAAGGTAKVEFSPAGRFNPEVDSGLERILERCLARKKEDRYPSASELLADLSRWQPPTRQPVSAPESGSASTFGKSAMGKPLTVNEEKGRELAKQAIDLGRDIRKIQQAADLMEQAFNQAGDLRSEYEWMVKLWRRGMMVT